MSVPGNTPHVLRPYDSDTDELYVLDTWTRSYSGKICEKSVAENPQWKLGKALLECCGCLVAAFDEDPSFILGYAVTSTDCVHYVYVRPEYRRKGLSKILLDSYLRRRGILYTHTPNRAWWPKPSVDGAKDPKALIESRGAYSRYNRGKSPTCKRCKEIGSSHACQNHFIPDVPEGWRYNPYHAFELASQTGVYRDSNIIQAYRST